MKKLLILLLGIIALVILLIFILFSTGILYFHSDTELHSLSYPSPTASVENLDLQKVGSPCQSYTDCSRIICPKYKDGPSCAYYPSCQKSAGQIENGKCICQAVCN